jgi:hypothetical protein
MAVWDQGVLRLGALIRLDCIAHQFALSSWPPHIALSSSSFDTINNRKNSPHPHLLILPVLNCIDYKCYSATGQ